MALERASNDIPLTVTISAERKSRGLVSVFDDVAAIRAVKVSRDRISDIPDEWKDGCGFYVLVSETVGGKFNAYVGKATQNNFYTRLSSHRREKGNWTTAFLFRRDTSSGLNSTQASYVEGAIYRVFETSPWINLTNIRTAGDKTLLDHEVFYMNQIVKSSLRILNIFGFVAGEDYKERDPDGAPLTRYYGVSVLDLVRSGLLIEGEETVSLMESIPATATIGDNGIIYQGKKGSPSGTAKEAKIRAQAGKTIANGWTFWGVYRNSQLVSLDVVRAYYLAQKELYEQSQLVETDVSFEDSLKASELSRQVHPSAGNGVATASESVVSSRITNNIISHKSTNTDPARHVGSRVKIYELVDAGLLEEGMVLVTTDNRYPIEATIANGGIALNGNIYPDPRIAGKYARRIFEPEAVAPENGWEFWAVQQPDGHTVSFSKILDDFA